MPNVIEVPLTHLEGHELLALAITVGFSENYKVEFKFHFEFQPSISLCLGMPRNRFCSRLIRQTSNGSGQRRIRYVITGKIKIYKVKYLNSALVDST